MFRTNSTVIAALIALVCTLGGCGSGSRQADTERLPAEGSRDGATFTSSSEALRMAEALHASGAVTEALAVIAAAYRRFPGEAAVISAYGRLAAINGQDELAARLLQEALAAQPEDWRALSARGVLAARSGHQDDANRTLAHARAMSGNDAVALNNLAVSLILDGNAVEAERLLRQALASPALKLKHQPRIRRNLAVALAIEGHATAAASIAGEPLPAGLRHADRATLRRLMGLAPAPEEQSNTLQGRAQSWRPVELRAGS